MAAYVYKDTVILGRAGGDFGNVGHVTAFSTQDGHQVWDWQTIPGPGQPGHETWPGNSWQHGGAAVWSGITIDPDTQTVLRRSRQSRTRSHDERPARKEPVRRLARRARHRERAAEGALVLPARRERHARRRSRRCIRSSSTARRAARTASSSPSPTRRATSRARPHQRQAALPHGAGRSSGHQNPPSKKGTPGCPNHGGGVEWNGGAYDPATNYFMIPEHRRVRDVEAAHRHAEVGARTAVRGRTAAKAPQRHRQSDGDRHRDRQVGVGASGCRIPAKAA